VDFGNPPTRETYAREFRLSVRWRTKWLLTGVAGSELRKASPEGTGAVHPETDSWAGGRGDRCLNVVLETSAGRNTRAAKSVCSISGKNSRPSAKSAKGDTP